MKVLGERGRFSDSLTVMRSFFRKDPTISFEFKADHEGSVGTKSKAKWQKSMYTCATFGAIYSRLFGKTLPHVEYNHRPKRKYFFLMILLSYNCFPSKGINDQVNLM